MSAAAPTPLERYFARRGVDRTELARGVTTSAWFSNAAAEHMATRRAAGLFDFSFMACFEITGNSSLAFLHRLQTRNLLALREGQLAYTLLLREDGSVINDATVWHVSSGHYLLFTGRRDDLQHLAPLAAGLAVDIADRSREQAVLAVQGQQAWAIMQRCLGKRAGLPPQLPYYGFVVLEFNGSPCLLARIGYSGETGYELVIAAEAAPALWQSLLETGAERGLAECGFSAIDSLRIEAGHILFMRELALPVTPFEIGLSRLVNFYNTQCRGVSALRRRRWQAPQHALAGLIADHPGCTAFAAQPCADFSAVMPGSALLTSACMSPVLKRQIGLGFVAAADRRPGTRVRLASGTGATVTRLPFYDPARFLARRTA
jgi:aminomethyltransferase